MEDRQPTAKVLARNLHYLMEDRGWTQAETAKRAGCDQKTISNILNEKKISKLDLVDSIAKAFGLHPWPLILPSLIDDLENGSSVADLYRSYFKSSREGRQHIISVAEREAEYNTREAS